MGTREQTGPTEPDEPAEETAPNDQGCRNPEEIPGEDPPDLDIAAELRQRSTSIQQTAKWLLELQDWEALENEIQEAAQSYEPPEDIDRSIVHDFLEEAVIAGNPDLALITCPRTQESHKQIGETWERLGPKWLKSFWEREDHIDIITQPHLLEDALEGFGPEADGFAPLSEILLCRPLDARTMLGLEPRGAHDLEETLTMATDLLGQQGIQVHHGRTSQRHVHLLVPSQQAIRAVAMLAELTDNPATVGSKGDETNVPNPEDGHETEGDQP